MIHKHIYLMGILGVVLLAAVSVSYIAPTSDTKHCLKGDEEANYNIRNTSNLSKESPLDIIVSNSVTGEEVKKFSTQILQPKHYHPVEIHDCGVYFFSAKNFDPKKKRQSAGYEEYVTKVDYSGKSKNVTLLAQKITDEEFVSTYSRDFRVNFNEKYISLIHGYGGKPDYALIVKDLNTQEDVFKLLLRNLHEEYPYAYGTLGLLDWTPDGRYLWAYLHEGAKRIAWIRVDTTDWSYDVYEAPEGVLGGHPLNINTGWVTVVPGTFWTGVADDTDIIRQERLAAGQTTSSLYLYNLFTQEKQLVETFDDPVWDGWPHKWIDDHTLQYTNVDKEVRTYTVTNE